MDILFVINDSHNSVHFIDFIASEIGLLKSRFGILHALEKDRSCKARRMVSDNQKEILKGGN